MQFVTKKKSAPKIDLSPLVDVVFLLIIFFAVSTTFREGTGLPVKLPSAGTATSQPAGPVEVTVGTGGKVEIQGTVYDTLSEAEAPLREALEQASPRVVLIRGDKEVAYETIVSVLDLARKFEAEGVTLATKRSSGAAAP